MLTEKLSSLEFITQAKTLSFTTYSAETKILKERTTLTEEITLIKTTTLTDINTSIQLSNTSFHNKTTETTPSKQFFILTDTSTSTGNIFYFNNF